MTLAFSAVSSKWNQEPVLLISLGLILLRFTSVAACIIGLIPNSPQRQILQMCRSGYTVCVENEPEGLALALAPGRRPLGPWSVLPHRTDCLCLPGGLATQLPDEASYDRLVPTSREAWALKPCVSL